MRGRGTEGVCARPLKPQTQVATLRIS
jgi:hypothetical protein